MAAVGSKANAAVFVHILELAAYKGLIHFYPAPALVVADLGGSKAVSASSQPQANPMQHEPCGLLCHADHPM
jgi:hypothetical protein